MTNILLNILKLKTLTFVVLMFSLFFYQKTYSQPLSSSVVEPSKYKSSTLWSCIDKHYAYTQLNYSLFIPQLQLTNSSNLFSDFKVGYLYRYKLAPKSDIGTELNYKYRKIYVSPINNFTTRNYANCLNLAIFYRFNILGANHRHLGLYLDLGCGASYSFSSGTKYTQKDNLVYIYKREKDAKIHNPLEPEFFLRLGYNYISCIFSANMSKNNSLLNNTVDNNKYLVFLSIGLQLNLYVK